ncbi:hypothetical protein [Bdellovibrio sp. HCB337]|uniref:hypothetical protein n=1 Tax=Bdellovibrio sp. HCB337 TaxID=3394358 RepID=UPI0039A45682
MKRSIAVLLSIFVGLPVAAQVPYAQLEKLRRQTVAVRVTMDAPEGATARECGLASKDLASLGGALSAATDSAAEKWQSLTISEADLPALKSKVAICKERGSCQIYEKFLSSAKTEDGIKAQVAEMQSSLTKTLETLESSTYTKALKTVPSPCTALAPLK